MNGPAVGPAELHAVDTLTWLLFESPAALLALLVPILFFLLVYWRRGGRARPLLIGLAVAAVLLIVQAWVVRPREVAGYALGRIELDLLASRTDALANGVSPSFRVGEWDRTRFLDEVSRALEKTQVEFLRRMELRVVRETADEFVVSASYLATVLARDAGGGGSLRSRWQIRFRREYAGWRIVDVKPESIDLVDVSQWGHSFRW